MHDVKYALLLLPWVLSAQTIAFSPQDYSRIPGLREIRVYLSDPAGRPTQVKGMDVVLQALHQNIRVYSYPNLVAYVARLNKRSVWRWIGVVSEAGGWTFVSGTALESIKVKEKSAKAAVAGLATVMTIGRTLYDREYRPVEIPSDWMPPLIAVPAGGSVDYAIWAQEN